MWEQIKIKYMEKAIESPTGRCNEVRPRRRRKRVELLY